MAFCFPIPAFQIVSRFNVVTRKAGKVFDADQIDFAALEPVSYTHLDVYKRQSYPIFNLADIFVVIGVLLGAVYYLWFYDKYDKPK